MLRQEAEYGLALATEACGDLDQAIPILLRLQETAGDTLADERRIAITIALSRCYRQLGDLGEAVEVAERMLARMVGSGWTDSLVELGATVLAAYYERGDLLRAQHFAAELLAAADALGTPRAIVAANWNAATNADLAGRGEEAVPLAERALAVQSETGEQRNLARLRFEYAFIRLRSRPDEAAACRDLLLRAERELRESAAGTVDLAGCLMYRAHAEIALGRVEEAVECAQRGLEMLDETIPDLRADTHLVLSQAYLLLGRADEASQEIASAVKFLDYLPPSRMTAQSWLTAGAVLESVGDSESSAMAYQRAMQCGGL
jgi:tetratricopeptide (TPR) repeat protein